MKQLHYIYKKEVDWSVLNYGLNIPVAVQNLFSIKSSIVLNRGESKIVKLIIGKGNYLAKLTNIFFDVIKYPNHKDLLQIRYTPNSDISKMLKFVFHRSYEYLLIEKDKLDKKRTPLSVPEKQREYIAIYAADEKDTFYIECVTNDEIKKARHELKEFKELDLESLLNATDMPSIIKKTGIVKIRNLDKSIGDALKVAYEFKCQICGLFIGEQYSATVVNSHHIEYFSQSLNNNADNIMIICPNHHSIIHATNPKFDRMKREYIYPNGFTEGLRLNLHL